MRTYKGDEPKMNTRTKLHRQQWTLAPTVPGTAVSHPTPTSITVIDVRQRQLASAPAAIRPEAIKFMPVSALAIPHLLPFLDALVSHTRSVESLGIRLDARLDPTTAVVVDICESVPLVKFDFQTRIGKADPVLPIVGLLLPWYASDYHHYARLMRDMAWLLPEYAAGRVARFDMVSVVNDLIAMLQAIALSHRERTFAQWHLLGALEAPEKYV
jgi:hypothetical protein